MQIISRVLAVIIFAGWAGSAVAIPITSADIVTIDGTDWAQVDLFTNLSWDDINAVCPSGLCSAGGTLNGHDVEGWVWASIEDVNNLFNHYLSAAGISGPNLLGPGYDSYNGAGETFTLLFLDDFRLTLDDSFLKITQGWLRNSLAQDLGFKASMAQLQSDSPIDIAATNNGLAKDLPDIFLGAYFYKEHQPASGVPAPATITLFGLGLAGLGWARRRKS